jgi:hypothetical protein
MLPAGSPNPWPARQRALSAGAPWMDAAPVQSCFFFKVCDDFVMILMPLLSV